MDNIYLIGARGTGKSTLSNKVAKKMNREVLHMDDVLVERIGPIDQFVQKNGWAIFRDEETKLLLEISRKKNLVVDCGGGVVVRKKNRLILEKTGLSVWLKATPKTSFERISQQSEKATQRPPLTKKGLFEEISMIHKNRSHLYKDLADIEVDTDDISLSDVYQSVSFFLDQYHKVAVLIAEKTVVETIKMIHLAQPKIALMELRIDFIEELNETSLKKIMNQIEVPLIVTNRTKKEGGAFEGSEQERLALLECAIKFGADYVDLEFICGKETFDHFNTMKHKTKLICSYHDFEKVPDHLDLIYKEMKMMQPDIIKIACMGNCYDDNLRMFDLISKADIKIIGIVMGPFGKISRLLAHFFGAYISTYAPFNKTTVFAPGQYTLKEALSLQNKLRCELDT